LTGAGRPATKSAETINIPDDAVVRLLLQFSAVNKRKCAQGFCALAELTMAVAIVTFLRTISR
jgi:hypothetical protein